MSDRWFSDLTRRALTWGAWAVVVVTVLSSGPPAEAHGPHASITALSSAEPTL